MSLTEPTLADPITPSDAWRQAAARETPFGQYIGEKLLGGLEGMRPFSALEEATLPGRLHGDMATVIGGGTDEYGRQAPGMGVVGPTEGQAMMPKAEWEASPNYRPSLTWDEGMTPARAEALATQHDRLAWNQSLVERYQGGFMGEAAGFVAGLAPGIADPTNYVPLLGPAAKAAMVARLGVIGGNVARHGAEAAANTALFEPLTAEHARTFGQPYGWEDAAADIALGALAGSVGGAIHGGLEYRGGLREAATRTRLETVMAAADATSLAAEQVDRGLPVDVAPVLAGRLPEAPREPPPGIDAMHASPHEFDRFTLDKLGTGEGAAVYGHGLYFSAADAPDVHAHYLSKFQGATGEVRIDGKALEYPRTYEEQEAWDSVLHHAGTGSPDPLRAALSDYERMPQTDTTGPSGAGKSAAYLRGLIEKGAKVEGAKPAQSYKVRLAVDRDRLLDWDKPLKDQPAPVREAVHKVVDEIVGGRVGSIDAETGASIYQKWLGGAEEKAPATASRLLHEAGLHGIQYLDAQSRSTGDGTHNYVVFDETRVHTLERNGRPVSFAAAAPEEPHPSVAEAAKRVGKAADPLATFKQDAALEGYQTPLPGHEPKPEPGTPEAEKAAKPQPPPTREEKAAATAALPPELAEIEAMKREGSFTPGDEATLAAGEAEAQRAENYAAAWQTLAGCVARAVAA